MRKKVGILILVVIISAIVLIGSLENKSAHFNRWLDKPCYKSLVKMIDNNDLERVYFIHGINEDGMTKLIYDEPINLDDIEKPEFEYVDSLWDEEKFDAKYVIEIHLTNSISLRFPTADGEVFWVNYEERTFKITCPQFKEFISRLEEK